MEAPISNNLVEGEPLENRSSKVRYADINPRRRRKRRRRRRNPSFGSCGPPIVNILKRMGSPDRKAVHLIGSPLRDIQRSTRKAYEKSALSKYPKYHIKKHSDDLQKSPNVFLNTDNHALRAKKYQSREDFKFALKEPIPGTMGIPPPEIIFGV